jgi:anti-anti-sigma factor
MDITSLQLTDQVVLRAVGRLDSHWADHLTRHLDELVRGGQHRITLDLAGIDYISSMGIRVLVSFHKKLKAIDGRFAIERPSEAVGKVLQMAGLLALLAPASPEDSHAAPPAVATPVLSRALSSASSHGEVFDLGGSGMVCRIQGQPEMLDGCRFTAADCRTLSLPLSSVGLGLGALGNSFDACRDYFGEFLAVAGAVVSQPGNGSNNCDYLSAEGDYVPEIQSLYSLVCEGQFSHLVRFEPRDAAHPSGLTELAETALSLSGAPAVCFVIAAESAGLIGASLRRSPAAGPDREAPFGFPAMRDWLSFSTERLDAGAMVVAAGVVADGARCPEALRPFLRPLGVVGGPIGHVHGVPFRYKPLAKGLIDPQRSLKPLFDSESGQGVLHLLCDDREPGRVEESRFLRGACWVAPLTVGTDS